MTDLVELKALAEVVIKFTTQDYTAFVDRDIIPPWEPRRSIAEFREAANPSAILSLIERVERAEREVAASKVARINAASVVKFGDRGGQQSYRAAHKDCIQWLHARASDMNDPHAAQVLNAAAFSLGQVNGNVATAIRAKAKGV